MVERSSLISEPDAFSTHYLTAPHFRGRSLFLKMRTPGKLVERNPYRLTLYIRFTQAAAGVASIAENPIELTVINSAGVNQRGYRLPIDGSFKTSYTGELWVIGSQDTTFFYVELFSKPNP